MAGQAEFGLAIGKFPHSPLARRMHASGESATTIAKTLGVSRATAYRVLAEDSTE